MRATSAGVTEKGDFNWKDSGYSVDLCGTLDFPRKVRRKVTITLNIREHIENTIQRYSTKFNDIQRYSTIFNKLKRANVNDGMQHARICRMKILCRHSDMFGLAERNVSQVQPPWSSGVSYGFPWFPCCPGYFETMKIT